MFMDNMSYDFITMTSSEVYEELKRAHGTHSRAARTLGIDPRVYRRWRSTGKLPKFAKKYLELLLSQNGNGTPKSQDVTQ